MALGGSRFRRRAHFTALPVATFRGSPCSIAGQPGTEQQKKSQRLWPESNGDSLARAWLVARTFLLRGRLSRQSGRGCAWLLSSNPLSSRQAHGQGSHTQGIGGHPVGHTKARVRSARVVLSVTRFRVNHRPLPWWRRMLSRLRQGRSRSQAKPTEAQSLRIQPPSWPSGVIGDDRPGTTPFRLDGDRGGIGGSRQASLSDG